MRASSEGPAAAPVTTAPGLAPGIYVHVPFCARVCPYCDFAVQTGGPRRRQGYVAALRAEIRRWGRAIAERRAAAESGAGPGNDADAGSAERGAQPGGGTGGATEEVTPAWPAEPPFDTVYLGGGTPSALEPAELERIVATLRDDLPIDAVATITLEANPEDVSAASVAAWRALGVTTLSLGVQSFDGEALRFLGRAHTPEHAVAAVETALAAGFETVSIDLIYALPQQSDAHWRAELERAVALRPQHLSCYELTIHEGTRFGRRRERGELVEAPEEHRADLFVLAHELLAAAGYDGYEVSNFAAGAPHRSRHNRKYWEHAAYLGVGPSAHSFDGVATRWWNRRRLADWQEALGSADGAGLAIEGSETLRPADLVLEALALGLRTRAGVDLEGLRRRYGIDLLAANKARIERMQRRGLVVLDAQARLVPTLRGLAVADALARELDVPPGN